MAGLSNSGKATTRSEPDSLGITPPRKTNRALSAPEPNPPRPEMTRSEPSSTARNPVLVLSNSRERDTARPADPVASSAGAQHRVAVGKGRQRIDERRDQDMHIDDHRRRRITIGDLLDHLEERRAIRIESAERFGQQQTGNAKLRQLRVVLLGQRAGRVGVLSALADWPSCQLAHLSDQLSRLFAIHVMLHCLQLLAYVGWAARPITRRVASRRSHNAVRTTPSAITPAAGIARVAPRLHAGRMLWCADAITPSGRTDDRLRFSVRRIGRMTHVFNADWEATAAVVVNCRLPAFVFALAEHHHILSAEPVERRYLAVRIEPGMRRPTPTAHDPG